MEWAQRSLEEKQELADVTLVLKDACEKESRWKEISCG
jgi:hypothetical protein